MLDTLRGFTDRLLGRGSAAITVPVMDGVLKPNRALDEAQVVATLDGIDDLAFDGAALYASAGPALYRLVRADGDRLVQVHRFDREITALAVQATPAGPRFAVALAGTQVRLLSPDGAVRSLETMAGRALRSVNALAFDGAGRLLVTDGSAEHDTGHWCHDLMSHGATGRLCAWNPQDDKAEELARGLRHARGALALPDGSVLVSESWRHRVLRQAEGAAAPWVAELPGYPSRMAPAAGGGFWLSCFVCRTQLVEFVLRENAYRRRMLREIDPRYWIAPALSSGESFLEPLQGAGVKQMGVRKPWAPPRSYGLVLRVNAQGHVVSSLHSQVDGQHHGITAVAEVDGALYAVSRGSRRLLRVPLAAAHREGAAA